MFQVLPEGTGIKHFGVFFFYFFFFSSFLYSCMNVNIWNESRRQWWLSSEGWRTLTNAAQFFFWNYKCQQGSCAPLAVGSWIRAMAVLSLWLNLNICSDIGDGVRWTDGGVFFFKETKLWLSVVLCTFLWIEAKICFFNTFSKNSFNNKKHLSFFISVLLTF